MRRALLWLGGSVILCVLVVGCCCSAPGPIGGFAKPVVPVPAGPDRVPTPKSSWPISAVGLVAAYEANEVAANAMYKGELLEVDGVVDAIRTDPMGRPYIVIGTGDPRQHGAVRATLAMGEASEAARLIKGAKITVLGKCIGLELDVQLVDAVITK